MGIEIERRFLVIQEKLPDLSEYNSCLMKQAYLSRDPWIRIRIVEGNTPRAVLTVKGKGTLVRPEVNCPIPMDKALEMWPMAQCGSVHKIRHNYGQWEIDEFVDSLSGLWLAEIELEHEDTKFDRPDWLGQEVTEDIRYSNAYMAEHGLPG